MDAVIYGVIPNANIVALARAPPPIMLAKLNMEAPPSSSFRISGFNPGTGIAAP